MLADAGNACTCIGWALAHRDLHPAPVRCAHYCAASANPPVMRQSAALSTHTKDFAMKLARLRRRRNRLRRDLRTRGKL
jgi:hypothetical protein